MSPRSVLFICMIAAMSAPLALRNSAGQTRAADEKASRDATSEPKQMYVRVEFMQVPDDGDELYRDVEDVWKKIHQKRIDTGLISAWILCKVTRARGIEPDYDYAVVHVADSLDKLTRALQYKEVVSDISFSAAEQALLSKTGNAREQVRSEIWQLETSAAPENWGRDGIDEKFSVNFMQSKDQRKHLALEKSLWRKLFAQRVKEKSLWNWSLWSRHADGNQEDGPAVATVHCFPEKGLRQEPEGTFVDLVRRVFPDRTVDQLTQDFELTDRVREIVARQDWTIVDSLGSPPPQTVGQ